MSSLSLLGSITAFDPTQCRFENYIARFRSFLKINNVKITDQVDVFVACIGDSMFQLLVNLCTPIDPKLKTFDELVVILQNHYEPPALEVAERQHFLSRRQLDGESISSFVADLKKMSISCNFGDYLSSALRDQFIAGIRRDSTKRRLLTELDLSFD